MRTIDDHEAPQALAHLVPGVPMSDLASFLLDRIAEDERLARLARDTEPALWADVEQGGIPDLDVTMATVAVMNRWSPRLVLAECEAKRRIIDEHLNVNDGDCGVCVVPHWGYPSHGGSHPKPWPCPTLLFLALPYADHPDYQEEWRP